MPRKPFRLLLLLAAVFAFLMIYQGRRGAIESPGFINHSLNAANDLRESACSFVKDAGEVFRMDDPGAERLSKELAYLRIKEQFYRETHLENERLRELLAIKEKSPDYVASARVISKGMDRWSNTLIIDKGADDLVGKDMTVIAPGGLVGKIRDVHGSYSSVLLLDDAKFSASVRLQEERIEAVLSGAGRGRCQLKYIDSDSTIEEGQVLITSGLDGLFPSGINVGYISGVSTKKDALFHNVEATPFVDTRKVEEVIILKR